MVVTTPNALERTVKMKVPGRTQGPGDVGGTVSVPFPAGAVPQQPREVQITLARPEIPSVELGLGRV